MMQMPMIQLGADAFKREPRYVTAREFREFADWFAKEFRVRTEPKEPTDAK